MLQEDAGPNWAHGAQLRSCTCRPGGSDCLSLSASTSVYRYFEQRTLNLVMMAPVFLFFDFLIRTARASFRRAVSRKSLISLICFGMAASEAAMARSLPM